MGISGSTHAWRGQREGVGAHRPQARLRGADARDHMLFALLPAAATIWMVHFWQAGHLLAVDFSREYRVAGLRVLDGSNPYHWTARQIAAGQAFPYPAAAALLFVPFALIPAGVSEFVFTGLCVLAVLVSLRVLGVRDWRCYGLVLVWPPVVAAWQTANLTLLLVLGVALVWRYRDRPVIAGVLCAVLISLKPYLWPLALWLLAGARYRACGWALVAGGLVNLVAWSVIGPAEFAGYLHLSGEVTGALQATGYGAIALAAHVGAGRLAGVALAVALSAALAAGCVVSARRGRDRERAGVCAGADAHRLAAGLESLSGGADRAARADGQAARLGVAGADGALGLPVGRRCYLAAAARLDDRRRHPRIRPAPAGRAGGRRPAGRRPGYRVSPSPAP